MTNVDSLGDRLKKFENVNRFCLPIRTPLIVRLDGCHFSNYTKGFEKPYSSIIRDAFIHTSQHLFKNISGLQLIYQQSDEMSLLITDYKDFNTQSWMNKNIQKIVSISSSILTAHFNEFIWSKNLSIKKTAYFDSRAFCLPKEEVCNYFLWRERDWIRNSVSVLAQKNFSHKELHKKSSRDMLKMLLDKGISWENDLDHWQKYGYCVSRNQIMKDNAVRHSVDVDWNIPVFSDDRNYVEKYVYLHGEKDGTTGDSGELQTYIDELK